MKYQHIDQGCSGGCHRCDAPQGQLVTLNNHETVCGACIEQMGNLLAVGGRVATATDPAPPAERGLPR